jgi:hypothetical protein
MSTKRVSRGRPLAPEEAAGYRQVREQVAGELADLIARHEQRTEHPGVGGEPPVPAREADTGDARQRPPE